MLLNWRAATYCQEPLQRFFAHLKVQGSIVVENALLAAPPDHARARLPMAGRSSWRPGASLT
jgi:hypothetical protein